jgi:hypothetical protein
MRGVTLGAVSAVGSILAHIAALNVLSFTVRPDTVPSQPSPAARLSMDTYPVDHQNAQAKPTAGDIASANAPDGSAIVAGAIERLQLTARQTPRQTENAADLPADQLRPRTAIGIAVKPSAHEEFNMIESTPVQPLILGQNKPAKEPISAHAASPTKLASLTPDAPAFPTSAVTGSNVRTSSPHGDTLAIQQLVGLAMQAKPALEFGNREVTEPTSPPVTTFSESSQLHAVKVDQDTPTQESISSLAISPTKMASLAPDAPASPTSPVLGGNVQTSSPKGEALPIQELDGLAMVANPAWDFGGRTVTDPTSLAVIQAFMTPGDLDQSDANTGQVRDDLSALLANVECSRLTATFIPETGYLELRGHVPDNSARIQVIDTLQSHIGDGITVTDNLLRLPSPQCGALAGIADIGLPQSTDQITNALLVGENAHAREYGFVEGQRLAFDLTSPDYDAVVYVDYFDAAGQVIHLVPNEVVALTLHPAKTTFGIGVDNRDQLGLNITIGPPFGQEITVAFAASVPLFDDPRPLIEPAEAYLEFLKKRVTETRSESPDFKGEWVYFFISTTPATQ